MKQKWSRFVFIAMVVIPCIFFFELFFDFFHFHGAHGDSIQPPSPTVAGTLTTGTTTQIGFP
jgi:hypothetical protein